jgi:hypothetical protein
MSSQTTVPYLTSDARLYKYVRVPGGRWKYLRADHDDLFLKAHSVFLPKSNHPVHIEGGYAAAHDSYYSTVRLKVVECTAVPLVAVRVTA